MVCHAEKKHVNVRTSNGGFFTMSNKQHDQENPVKRYIGIFLVLAGFLMLGMAISGFLNS